MLNRARCGEAAVDKRFDLSIILLRGLLTLLLLAFAPLQTMAQSGQYGDFFWRQDGAAMTITGYAGTDSAVVFPSTINDLPVTSIGDYALYDYASVTSITIPNSVSSIGTAAFQRCSGLTSITIPDSVNSIGTAAFQRCSGLTNLSIGNSVTSIGEEAFSWCSRLTSVAIPNSVTNIASGAFGNCSGLMAITVDSGNSAYSSITGVLFNADQTSLIEYPSGGAGSYAIPNSVTSIENYAFWWCPGLTNVTIPNSVTNIGDYAFSICSNLTSVIIPNSVTSIGSAPFLMSGRLGAILVDPGNPAYCSVEGVLFNQSQSTLIAYPPGRRTNSYTTPESVANIGPYAFAWCTGLTNVTLSASVASIGTYAFLGCTGLTNVTLPASVASIETYAFARCSQLTKVYFQGNAPSPSNDTTVFPSDNHAVAYYLIGTTGWGHTFDGIRAVMIAGNLRVAIIPEGAVTIGAHWRVDGGALQSAGSTVTGLSVGTHTVSFTAVNRWLTPTNQTVSVALGATTTATGTYMQGPFDFVINNDGISVTITGFTGSQIDASIPGTIDGLTVTSIRDNALTRGFTRPGAVTIPNSVTSIGKNAFNNCFGMTSITVPDSVTNIGEGAFAYCAGLTNVTLSTNVTSIEDWLFFDCSGLTKVIIPASVASIGDYALAGCYRLTDVTIPHGVTNIGRAVFQVCNQLTAIKVDPDNPAYCSVQGVLYDLRQTALIAYPPGNRTGSYTLPNSVTNIGDFAFDGCLVTDVTIPASVASLGTNAFTACSFLTNIYFLGNAPSGGSDWTVFSYDFNATVYYLPGTTGWGTKFGGRPTALWTPVATLSVQSAAPNVVLTWSSGVLLESTNLAGGIWTTNAAAQSPYTVAPDGPQKFYRVTAN